MPKPITINVDDTPSLHVEWAVDTPGPPDVKPGDVFKFGIRFRKTSGGALEIRVLDLENEREVVVALHSSCTDRVLYASEELVDVAKE